MLSAWFHSPEMPGLPVSDQPASLYYACKAPAGEMRKCDHGGTGIAPKPAALHIGAMASPNQIPIAAAASLDTAIGFALPTRHARGRLVRLRAGLQGILPPPHYP